MQTTPAMVRLRPPTCSGSDVRRVARNAVGIPERDESEGGLAVGDVAVHVRDTVSGRHSLDESELAPATTSPAAARARSAARPAAVTDRRPPAQDASGRSACQVGSGLRRSWPGDGPPAAARPPRPRATASRKTSELTVDRGVPGASAYARCDHTPTTTNDPVDLGASRGVDQRRPVTDRSPGPAETGVDLEVDASSASTARGRGSDRVEHGLAGDREVDVGSQCLAPVARPARATRPATAPSMPAARSASASSSSATPSHSAPPACAARADGHQPVTVGIGLDDGHHARMHRTARHSTAVLAAIASRSTISSRAGGRTLRHPPTDDSAAPGQGRVTRADRVGHRLGDRRRRRRRLVVLRSRPAIPCTNAAPEAASSAGDAGRQKRSDHAGEDVPGAAGSPATVFR